MPRSRVVTNFGDLQLPSKFCAKVSTQGCASHVSCEPQRDFRGYPGQRCALRNEQRNALQGAA